MKASVPWRSRIHPVCRLRNPPKPQPTPDQWHWSRCAITPLSWAWLLCWRFCGNLALGVLRTDGRVSGYRAGLLAGRCHAHHQRHLEPPRCVGRLSGALWLGLNWLGIWRGCPLACCLLRGPAGSGWPSKLAPGWWIRSPIAQQRSSGAYAGDVLNCPMNRSRGGDWSAGCSIRQWQHGRWRPTILPTAHSGSTVTRSETPGGLQRLLRVITPATPFTLEPPGTYCQLRDHLCLWPHG